MASNLVVQTDAAGNMKPDKERSSERIDGMVALCNALGRAMTYQAPSESKSVYDERAEGRRGGRAPVGLREIALDAMLLVGAALVVRGVWLLSPAAAHIIGGLVLVVGAVWLFRGAGLRWP